MATKKGKKTLKDKKIKKDRKVEAFGIVHIKASFNNTIVTITDRNGDTLSWASAGLDGDYKSSKKSTPFAAQVASEKASKKAYEMGVREVEVYVKGPGMGRERLSLSRTLLQCLIMAAVLEKEEEYNS